MGIKRKIAKEDVKSFSFFFLTALFGAAVNFGTQIPYESWLSQGGMDESDAYSWSIIASYLTATVLSFIPAKLLAFSAKETGNTKRETIKFLIIALLALVIQEGMSVFILENIANPFFTEFNEFIRKKGSHLGGMGFSFLANFFGHRLITFRSTGFYEKLKPNK
ncbi:Putative flippase GtrA (transmembrane translocase of bactoprenol-linked glucose) [Spirosomataceae bacterium TFI 002]|nr:Putative flippase GtrA (transmembrane translocase of bactoprenol-linked glucose) [Spirosomataceae bacterium TFI 002]